MPEYIVDSTYLSALGSIVGAIAEGYAAAETHFADAQSKIFTEVTENLNDLATLALTSPTFNTLHQSLSDANSRIAADVAEIMTKSAQAVQGDAATGYPAGTNTIEKAMTFWNQVHVPPAAGDQYYRRAAEALGLADLKRWNYLYKCLPNQGFYLAKQILGVFGAGNTTIDQTKYRGGKLTVWPTQYGGTPFTPTLTCTVYDPSTDTFLTGKTYVTSSVVNNANSGYTVTYYCTPGGASPGPANASVVAVTAIANVHAASSIYVGTFKN